MHSLNDIRKEINITDEKIKELFFQRMELAKQVAKSKLETDDKILKQDRENELIELMSYNIDDSLKKQYISILKTFIRVSRMCQYEYILEKKPEKFDINYLKQNINPKIVVYQGLPASYQSKAVNYMFPNTKEKKYVKNFEDVFNIVSQNSADIGVIPIENSSIGTINEVYDLLFKHDLYICLSHIDNINHCLAACKDATIESIRQVHSIEPALEQCKIFLSKNNFELCKESNTAVAAQKISMLNDKTKAAICSKEAANLYNLKIISDMINDNQKNQTRFVAITKKLYVSKDDEKISVSFTLPHTDGALSSTLSIFSDRNINLTQIHSRPIIENPWTYRFYADFEGNLENKNIKSLIYQLSQELPSFKLIGSYKTTRNT